MTKRWAHNLLNRELQRGSQGDLVNWEEHKHTVGWALGVRDYTF